MFVSLGDPEGGKAVPETCREWRIVVLVILILLLFPKRLDYYEFLVMSFQDDGGRQVDLPPEINKVYATTELGFFLVYALEPDVMLGWNRGLSPQLEFAIDPQYHNLPTVGTWDHQYQTARLDLLRELKPDVIVHYAPVDPQNMLLVEEIEKTLETPVILVDNSLQTLPRSLQILGKVLGKEPRGQALATYVENCLERAYNFQRMRVSYGTIPVHLVSPHPPGHFDELLTLAGMAEMPIWNNHPPFPDFVLIMPHSVIDPYGVIEKDGHKRIYQIPTFPSNWLEPGSIFSILGVEWLHSIAYPHTYPVDLAETYRMFMEIFFQVNITPELLSWTLQRSGISF